MMGWLTLRALDAVLPGDANVPGLAATATGPALVARLRSEAPFEMRLVLNLAVWLWLFSPIVTVFLPLPAIWLAPAAKDRHTDRLSTAKIYLVRQAILLLKQVAGLAWGQDPEVRRAYHLQPYTGDPGTFRGDGR
jgi:hypothetical protein